MKKIIILALMLPSLLYGQQISLNKDSLSITNDFPDGYTGTAEFSYLDSLWIKNVGQETLKIDSMKTQNSYSYRTKIIYQDSIEYSILHNYEGTITLEILPQDSIKIIFADPDLCPICEAPSVLENFTDKFYIYSNSIVDRVYEVYVSGIGFSTDVQEETPPLSFQLYQNFPNPFNPITTITFEIDRPGHTRINIYDLLGNQITTLLNDYKNAGIYRIKFDGSSLSSGVYFYSITFNNFMQTKSMILLK